jgi:hypothetical protein
MLDVFLNIVDLHRTVDDFQQFTQVVRGAVIRIAKDNDHRVVFGADPQHGVVTFPPATVVDKPGGMVVLDVHPEAVAIIADAVAFKAAWLECLVEQFLFDDQPLGEPVVEPVNIQRGRKEAFIAYD